MDVDLLIIFISGIIIGITPCTMLLLSIFGGSAIFLEGKSKYIKLSVGLISGMLIAYIVISVIFVSFLNILESIYLFKHIFAIVLISIGVWQILECKKEKSIIFGTPQKIKLLLKEFIDKRTFLYSFLIGVIFTLVKVPCFSGIYLNLLCDFLDDPLFYLYIATYLIGLIIPMILLLSLLRLTISFNRVNEFRLKYRVYLRILNGVVLIMVTLYLLFN